MNAPKRPADWTVGAAGRSNTSRQFRVCVGAVTRLLRAHRLGEDPASLARVIVAQLAHGQGLAPQGRKPLTRGGLL